MTRKYMITKMSVLLVAVVAGCMSCNSSQDKPLTDTKKIPKEYIETFQVKDCKKIVLEQYGKMSDEFDETPPQQIREITDEQTINEIISLAGALPDKGEIMKKMNNVPLLKTTLFCKEDTVFFDYYEDAVKTPATSFYASAPKEEKALYELLVSLLKK
jgi:hypothetical protein